MMGIPYPGAAAFGLMMGLGLIYASTQPIDKPGNYPTLPSHLAEARAGFFTCIDPHIRAQDFYAEDPHGTPEHRLVIACATAALDYIRSCMHETGATTERCEEIITHLAQQEITIVRGK